ncbi:hypothetical protein PRIC1_012328 [Phytophthora ramorum]
MRLTHCRLLDTNPPLQRLTQEKVPEDVAELLPSLLVWRTFDSTTARTLTLLRRRKVSTLDIAIFKRKNKLITLAMAYDYPPVVHVAGFDTLQVGDSLGMVELVVYAQVVLY